MSRFIAPFLTLAFPTLGCAPAEPGKVEDTDDSLPSGPTDADGDGSPEGEDCDDGDASVRPGADERCNGIDDDCDGETDEDDAVDAPEWFADADGDGHGDALTLVRACQAPSGTVATADDCDDADPERSPSADERCADELDNDCDGDVDEDDAVDAGTWYPDADGDGYGDLAAPLRACEQPDDTLTYAGDCDDGDPDINPEGTETCDGVDQDCNGLVDEDATDARTWYTDGDGDGFGDADRPVLSCDEPSGATEVGGDCEDTDPTVNPDAEEICEDGLDNDCDGSAGDCRLLGSLAETTASSGGWSGAAGGDSLGYAVALLGDIDGDGAGDAVIGAYGEDGGGSGAGRTWLLYGSSTVASAPLSAAPSLTGPAAGDFLGFALDAAGDVDGDGLADVVIGAQGDDRAGDRAGAAWVWLGGTRASGTTSIDVQGAAWTGEAAGDAAGYGVAGVGDLDGDGFDDLLIGAREAADDAGVAYLLYGGSSIGSGGSLADADAAFTGAEPGDRVGERFAMGAGDIDGDGVPEFVFGAYDSDAGATRGGAVHVVAGTSGRVSGDQDLAAADTTLEGPLYARLGWSVGAGGDLDGDGYGDLVAGGYDFDDGAGVVYAWMGSTTAAALGATAGRAAATATLSGDADDDGLGRTLSLGDLDGDALADLAVAAPGTDGTAANAGAVHIIYGESGFAGTWVVATDADATITGSSAQGQLGWDLSAGGDLDGDGIGDLLLGAYGADGYAGQAWLVPGTGL
jgi:hypothetical protein